MQELQKVWKSEYSSSLHQGELRSWFTAALISPLHANDNGF